MAGVQLPGPVCRFLGALQIDSGTLCRSASPVPGPFGASTKDAVANNAVGDKTAQLGRLLLGSSYTVVTQDYDVYFKDGPTSETTKGGWHPGIDFAAEIGLKVFSPVVGVVASLDPEGTGYGRVAVKIDGTNDYFIFLHLSKVEVTQGDDVNIGTVIGRTGKTNAEAAHLHVELRAGKSLAAYYFKSKDATGVNKNSSSVIQ